MEEEVLRCDELCDKVTNDHRRHFERAASADQKIQQLRSMQKGELFSEEGLAKLKRNLDIGQF